MAGKLIANFNAMAVAQQTLILDKLNSKLGLTPTEHLDKPGSLVVIDGFHKDSEVEPHGQTVAESARGQGFKGNIIPSRHRGTEEYEKLAENLEARQRRNISPDEFKQLLTQDIVLNQSALLHSAARRLEGLEEAGLHHSAVNLSLGHSQADWVTTRYMEAGAAWHGGADQPKVIATLDNYARALDLNKDHLMSEYPAISGPERQKFQQALVDLARTSVEGSPPLGELRKSYDRAVHRLEERHNSVVISAGNSGDVLPFLREDAHGREIKIGPGFYNNILANSETTTVGATIRQDGREKKASYTSEFPGVSIYANGDVVRGDETARGTSFASPRVAAVMASLHQLYPEKSSAEIECMLKEQMTEQMYGASALDSFGAEQFLSNYTS